MRGYKMKIMVVDDEKDMQHLFEQRFRKERRNGEVELHFAFSAEYALSYIEECDLADLAVILSDINMPGMNGFQLLQIIREKYPGIRVLMITAYEDEENKQRAIAYGADAYLTKPLDFDELKKMIMD
jgi:CheY-like chemotaxis protein